MATFALTSADPASPGHVTLPPYPLPQCLDSLGLCAEEALPAWLGVGSLIYTKTNSPLPSCRLELGASTACTATGFGAGREFVWGEGSWATCSPVLHVEGDFWTGAGRRLTVVVLQ